MGSKDPVVAESRETDSYPGQAKVKPGKAGRAHPNSDKVQQEEQGPGAVPVEWQLTSEEDRRGVRGPLLKSSNQ